MINKSILSYNPSHDSLRRGVGFDAFVTKSAHDEFVVSNLGTSDYSNLRIFTSTGKERDEETGFTYHGARYYDATLLTAWTTVDPMADKYPGISPYADCAWSRPAGGHEHRLIYFNTVNNPVKLVDPDGRMIADYYNLKGEWIGTDGNDDGRIFLVTDESDVLTILENGENCDIQTTQISEVHSAIELPSVEIREEMLVTLIEQDAINPYREYGGLVLGEVNSVIGWASHKGFYLF